MTSTHCLGALIVDNGRERLAPFQLDNRLADERAGAPFMQPAAEADALLTREQPPSLHFV